MHADVQKLSAAVAQHCVHYISATITQHGKCHVALAGGATPKALYALLANPELARQIEWDKVHVYFGDERYVPHDSPASNYCMARTVLLDKVPLPGSNIHPVPTRAADAQRDAQAYAALLENNLPLANRVPVFDLILLGMGEDGHTASLFPGTSILHETQQPAAAVYVDKLASWRISLTYPVLNAARCVICLLYTSDAADE